MSLEASANRQNYNGVKIDLSNCILPDTILNSKTPSEMDGLDPQIEQQLRATGCELISNAGILLKLPQTAMATAQVLFQRYFYAKSFVKHDMEMLSMAGIWLASKIEEEPRRARDVINVYTRIKQCRDDLDIVPVVVDEAYKRKKDDLVKAERFMLKELGFCVHVKHPHKLVVIICKKVMAGLCADESQEQELVQTSWNFMNDSFRSRHLFVKYPPEKIACGCIFLACRVLGIATPCQPYWFEVLDCEPADVFQIAQHIMSLYRFEKIPIHELLETVKNVQANNRKNKIEARKRKHDDQLKKITAAQEAAKTPESAAAEAARVASSRVLENGKNRSREGSGMRRNGHGGSRSPPMTAKDLANKSGGKNSSLVYVNPATQVNMVAAYGDKFDQPERVGSIYKSSNQTSNSQVVNLVDQPPVVKDFHSGKMLDEITSKERSPEEFLPSGKSGYTRKNSKDHRDRSKSRSQGRKYSSSESEDSVSEDSERRHRHKRKKSSRDSKHHRHSSKHKKHHRR